MLPAADEGACDSMTAQSITRRFDGNIGHPVKPIAPYLISLRAARQLGECGHDCTAPIATGVYRIARLSQARRNAACALGAA